MTRRCLAVRLDSTGDVLLAGPAIRAIAAHCDSVTILAGPDGAAAARLLPGAAAVLVWSSPWVVRDPPPVRAGDVLALAARLTAEGFTDAVIFTSFHQSPLPTALVLRLAGIPRIAAISEDYPGSLLDLRHTRDRCLTSGTAAMAASRKPSGRWRWPAPQASACRPVITAGWPCGSRCPT